MVGDNDAGGVSTYAQAGQNFGLTLLWTLPLLIPVLIVNQEMVVRLGAVTGVGHARLINERFGRFWGMFSVGDLFILNFLTIATEFIGVSLALGYFGVSEYVSVPIAAVTLIAMTATGSFRRWERFMFVFIVANFLVIPLAIHQPPDGRAVLQGLRDPGRPGRLQLDLGAPDHRHRGHDRRAVAALLPAVEHRGQADHAALDQLRAGRHRHRLARHGVRRSPADGGRGGGLRRHAAIRALHRCRRGGPGPAALRRRRGRGTIFAIILLNASIIGAASVTLSTSYAFGDVFGARHSLHRSWRGAKFFYGTFTAMVVCAAGIVIIPGAPLGVITTGVQALAGVLLPSATVFLLLLCNDKDVLGPWVNRPWLNVVAGVIVSILLDDVVRADDHDAVHDRSTSTTSPWCSVACCSSST